MNAGNYGVKKIYTAHPYFLFTQPLRRVNRRLPLDKRVAYGGERNSIMCSASAVLFMQLPKAMGRHLQTKQYFVGKRSRIRLTRH